MSHVATIAVQIKDLASLKKACERVGLEFREGQKTYKWWGRHVGDYPLPAGFTKADLGKSTHALAVKGKKDAYEIGVVESRTTPGTYELLWDFYAGGKGLEAAVGKDAKKLMQAYSTEVARKAARRAGFRVTETKVDGKVVLRCRK